MTNVTPDPALDAEPIKDLIGTTGEIWMGVCGLDGSPMSIFLIFDAYTVVTEISGIFFFF